MTPISKQELESIIEKYKIKANSALRLSQSKSKDEPRNIREIAEENND